jgi:hypothetical protein
LPFGHRRKGSPSGVTQNSLSFGTNRCGACLDVPSSAFSLLCTGIEFTLPSWCSLRGSRGRFWVFLCPLDCGPAMGMFPRGELGKNRGCSMGAILRCLRFLEAFMAVRDLLSLRCASPVFNLLGLVGPYLRVWISPSPAPDYGLRHQRGLSWVSSLLGDNPATAYAWPWGNSQTLGCLHPEVAEGHRHAFPRSWSGLSSCFFEVFPSGISEDCSAGEALLT